MENEFESGLLKYIDKDFLKFIQSLNIGIAGLGGLGSNILNSMARTGFNKFTICDFDKVEASNLNRQYYNIEDIGLYKSDAIIKNINKINKNIEFTSYNQKLDETNMNKIFDNCHIIFEAFDNPISKKELFTSFHKEKNKIIIFGSGMAGFNIIDNNIKIKKIKENIYMIGDLETNVSNDTPPLAPKVIAVASTMAAVAFEIIYKQYLRNV